MKFFKKRFKGLLAGIVLALAISFLTTLYAPLELFMGSQSDFWFTLKQLLCSAGLLFLCSFAALSLLFFFLRLTGKIPYAVGLSLVFSLL
ncbi:MAG: hypothetical protein IJN42_00905, partial [Clostridia bacterium]|nr:hypothetical protein [Clostridia bacterium]